MKNSKWVKRWQIEKSTGDGFWVVAIDKDDNYGCSCPVWKFKREECKHIQYVKANPQLKANTETTIKKPEIILARVSKPKYQKRTNKLLIPLVPFGDVWMNATICYSLLQHGFSWGEITQIRRLPSNWTKAAVCEHIERNGLAEYANIGDCRNSTLKKQAS